jgi:DNA (cytosine-5)-methyltransferase 1
MEKYRMATLFSGAGGLDMGFKLQSRKFNMLFANDILEEPAKSYSNNFRHKIVEVKKWKGSLPAYVRGDIADIDFAHLEKLDCLVGGPPCQDFSVTRGGEGPSQKKSKRKGIRVKRGRLYQQYVRAIRKTRPKVIAFENVPGLVSANDGMAYKAIQEDFEVVGKLRYHLIFNKVVSATAIGVPQSRRRLVIMGVRTDIAPWPRDNELMQRAETVLTGANSLLRKYPICAMEALEGKTVPELASRYRKVMKQYEGVDKEVNKGRNHPKNWKEKVWDKLTFKAVDDYLHANKITERDSAEENAAFREHKKVLKDLGYYGRDVHGRKFKDDSNEIPNETESVTGRMERTPPGENYIFVDGTKWEVRGTMSNIYRRTDPLRPAFTVMAYGGGGTWSYHYDRDRGMLTNRERARLQTFPDDYMFEGDRSQVRAQIGEAVPVQLGRKIAEVAEIVLGK